MAKNTKNTIEAMRLLREYSGQNPFILAIRRDVCVKGNSSALNELAIEYILKNYDKEIKVINKAVKITDWYGESLKEKYNLDFTPTLLAIKTYLGETSTCYHCYAKYKKSMEPISIFLSKKGVLTDFLAEDYNSMNIDFDRYDRLSTAKDPNRKLKSHQKTAVKFLLSRKKCVLADDMGLGKLEPNSSLIPTPVGYKKMGEITVGDCIFGRDGKSHTVLKTFPHKDKEIYKVIFSDGTSVECGLEHLWVVRDSNMRLRGKGWKIMSLEEILKSGITYNDYKRKEKGLKPRNKYEIPVAEAVEYSEKDYFIHPYILGYCIGDGNLCSGSINISIPDFEKESVDRLNLLLKEDYILKEDRSANCPRYRIISKERTCKNNYIREIIRLGLNVHGNDKFIPEEYKFGSIQQRLDLLRGLMDSDGTITKANNRIVYSTNSKKLSNDVKELVYSLGGIARIHAYDRRNKGKNIEYHVNIQIKFNPFYLSRKAERYNPTHKKYCTKYITSCEYVRNEDATCLYVDSYDHTYLTGKSYIVTHNTTSLAVSAIEGNYDSILIICPQSLKNGWKRELMWYVPERDITIIEGYLDKTKSELEEYLGYGIGRSGKNVKELQQEAKEKGKWRDNRFVIVNFDILDEFYKLPESRSKENIQIAHDASPMLQYIENKKSLIIIDEAHRLSNTSADRYHIVKDLIRRGKPEGIFLATGTPITNNPQNFYNLLNLLDEPVAADWNYYMERYCGAIKIPKNKEEKEKRQRITDEYLRIHGKTYWYQLTDDEKAELNEKVERECKMMLIYKEATNLDELKEKTAHIYLRRTKEDIGDLPNKTVHEMFYELTPQQKQEYDRLWSDYETAQLEADPDKELNKELLEGAIYRGYCSVQMIPNTIKLAENFINNGEKVIIACCYDEELYTLKDYFGDKCVIYNGKMSTKEKSIAEEQFMNNPDKMVFIGNMEACSMGLTLIVSHIIIFNNFHYTSAICHQMEDRIFRIGQTHDVDIYYQMFRGTQYEKMWNIILKKDLIINQIIKKEDEKRIHGY